MSTSVTAVRRPTAPGPPRAHRSVVAALGAGLVLTIATLALPYLDRATSNVLAGHIHSGYPAMSPQEIDTAVTTYLIALTTVGTLGILCWVGSLWLAHHTPRWSPVVSSVVWLSATAVAVFALTVTDTSGDTGLPAPLGWAGVTPCVAGLVAVVQQWRHR